jgi:hypothetical protein
MLVPNSSSDAIAQAATDIFRDDRFTAGAQRLAVAIGGCGGATEAAVALEALVPSAVAAASAG